MSLDNSMSPPCPELTLHRRRGRAHFVLVSTSFCNNGTTGLLPSSTTAPTLLQALGGGFTKISTHGTARVCKVE